VSNGGARALRGCSLVVSGRAYIIGDVAAGTTIRRTFWQADAVEMPGEGALFRGDDGRRAALWKAEAGTDDQGRGPARLIGWMDGPVLPLAFPGGNPMGGRPGLALVSVVTE
jgi:hypothetical protein